MTAVDKNGTVTKQNDVSKKEEIDSGKEAVAAAYSKLMEAKEHFKHAAEAAGMDWKQDAEGQLMKGKAKAEELCEQANSYLHDKPLATLGLAFAAGFLVSQLMSKK